MFSMLYKLFLAVLAASAMFANGPVAPVNSCAYNIVDNCPPCEEGYKSSWQSIGNEEPKLYCLPDTPISNTEFYILVEGFTHQGCKCCM